MVGVITLDFVEQHRLPRPNLVILFADCHAMIASPPLPPQPLPRPIPLRKGVYKPFQTNKFKFFVMNKKIHG